MGYREGQGLGKSQQ
ncbi:unnamed protein product, partial [Rotaria magnacalcarata]